jgi:hypothetical protein
MASGKHSADKFDLFNKKKIDKEDYTEVENEDETVEVRPRNEREDNFEEYYEQPLQVRLENARDDEDDEEYDDEDYYGHDGVYYGGYYGGSGYNRQDTSSHHRTVAKTYNYQNPEYKKLLPRCRRNSLVTTDKFKTKQQDI